MHARRRVCLIDVPADDGLRRKVEQYAPGENKREAMLKDIHLVEAAFQADKIVISMDETVRKCFHEVTHEIRKLKQIAWVNPCKSEETALNWLQNGAELERERLLGYRQEDANAND
jgi:ABC-type iron transport system FetAB ATPase subunit